MLSVMQDIPMHLAAPPRSVPFSLRLLNIFNPLAQGAWLLFGFGMIFFWFFGTNADYSFVTFRGPHSVATGRVLRVEDTAASSNESRVRAAHYEYSVAGQTFRGISYLTNGAFDEGTAVPVEYDVREPMRSRIAGWRRALFEAPVALITLVPLLGILLLIPATRSGRLRNHLLRDGILTTGRLVKKEATSTRINKQRVWKLTFDYKARDGRHFQTIARTHLIARLEDERQEPLLYDPLDPQRAYVLDDAVMRPHFDGTGTLQGQPVRAIGALVLPGIAIGAHAFVLLVKLGIVAM